MKAVVLVAGYATRLYPLTKNQPKGLLKLNGKPILDYLFEKLEKVEVVNQAILVSNNKFFTHFNDWAKNYRGRIKIDVINDQTTSNENRLGSLGDLQFAIDKYNIKEDTMVLVSDNVFSFELSDFYNFFKHKKTDCVVASKVADLEYLGKHFGVAILDENGKIINMEEKPGIPKSDIGIWSIYIYTKETIGLLKKYIDEGNNKDAPGNFPCWLYEKKPIHAWLFEGKCYDVGTLELYHELDKKFTEESKNN